MDLTQLAQRLKHLNEMHQDELDAQSLNSATEEMIEVRKELAPFGLTVFLISLKEWTWVIGIDEGKA